MKRLVTCGIVATLPLRAAASSEDVTNVEELSLQQLLDARVDVASKTPQTKRETPGVVTVITRDEIKNTGARDLLDVLALVPGFAPAVDVEGVVNFGIRGQWAHEGKMLLLIDGQQMNELLYSTLQLANHYPLEMIERIEVIRGPGSAMYGGYAELAVINIVTRDASTFQGVSVTGSYGQLGKRFGHAESTASFATREIHGISASGAISMGHAESSGTYRDLDGGSYAMYGSAARRPVFAKLTLARDRLRVDALYDDYALQTRDGVGPMLPAAVRQGFRAFHLAARYDLALRKDLTLTPYASLIHQTPWRISDRSSEMFYKKSVRRFTAGAALSYDPVHHVNLLAGVETFADRAWLEAPPTGGFQTMFGDRMDVTYDTIATYGQLLVNHRLANLTVGARYEHHSAVGSSLVPRVAVTRAIGRFHAKLLASQAFRAPGIENINLSAGSIAPERTSVFEGEVGYRLTEHMAVALNAFDITIRDPIIYGYDQATESEGYRNFEKTGTRGLELDYQLKTSRLSAQLNYSYYSASGKNEVSAYAVPDREDVLLAFPKHKLALKGTVELFDGFSVTPSAAIYSSRYGFTGSDADGTHVIGREAPSALVNVYARWRDVGVRGLELGAGVYDALDDHPRFLQPYDGGHAPLPSTGREVIVRIGYERSM